jgi:hypothetical protein
MVELYMQPMCEGAIVEAYKSITERVAPVNEAIKQHLTEHEAITCHDETGVRVNGKLH